MSRTSDPSSRPVAPEGHPSRLSEFASEQITKLRMAAEQNPIPVIRRLAEELVPGDPYACELAATRIAVDVPNILDKAAAVAKSRLESRETRFFCFAIALIACRRLRLHSQGRGLDQQVGQEFDDLPLYWHLKALSYQGGNLSELRIGLDTAKLAYSQLRENAGAAHSIALFIADIASYDTSISQKELQFGLEMVTRAISLNPKLPRFLYTRARLNRQIGEYQSAREDLVRAIDLEDRTGIDYRERVFDCLIESALVNVDASLNASLHEVQRTLDKATDNRLREVSDQISVSQIRIVETIAFVTAVLALVQITTSTLGQRPFDEAIKIVIVMGAMLFLAVGLGTFLLRRGMRSK